MGGILRATPACAGPAMGLKDSPQAGTCTGIRRESQPKVTVYFFKAKPFGFSSKAAFLF